MKVLLRAPASRHVGGYGRYVQGLHGGLGSIGVEAWVEEIRKSEASLLGRPFLGDTSLRMRARRRPVPGFDVVHATEPILANRHADVVTIHDAIPLERNTSWLPDAAYWPYVRRTLRRLADKQLVVPTQTVKDAVVRAGLPEDRIHVTYEGVDTDRFYPDEPDAQMAATHGRHVLLVGDLNPRKRWGRVLEAAASVDDIHVWHAGQTNRWEAQERRLDALGKQLPGRWHRLGPVSDERLRRLYSGCSLFVFPSESEGFGLPALEALACGAPVLASDIPVFRELLEGHATFTDASVGALRSAFEGLPARKGPRATLPDRFTWAEVARKTLAVYEEAP